MIRARVGTIGVLVLAVLALFAARGAGRLGGGRVDLGDGQTAATGGASLRWRRSLRRNQITTARCSLKTGGDGKYKVGPGEGEYEVDFLPAEQPTTCTSGTKNTTSG